MKIRGPFIEYECSRCGMLVSKKILAKRAEAEMEAIRESVAEYCAACWPPEVPLSDAEGE